MRALFLILFLIQTIIASCEFSITSYKEHYYSYISDKMTWEQAETYAEQYDGHLAVPNDDEENTFFLQNGWVDAWIGIYDPSLTANYCYTYDSCTPEATRFRQYNDDIVTYSKWSDKEPNNFVSANDFDSHGTPLVNPLGEHWALFLRNGFWADYGNHGGSYSDIFTAKFIIEFDASPSCENIVDTNESEPIAPTDPYCLPDTNGDGQAEEPVDCLSTNTQGVEICPTDMKKCEPSYVEADCLNGGILNTERDLCQTPSSIGCPQNYTFDAETDTCFKDINCQSPMSCESGYLLTENSNTNSYECQKNPSCSSGSIYNQDKNRCEQGTRITTLSAERGQPTVYTQPEINNYLTQSPMGLVFYDTNGNVFQEYQEDKYSEARYYSANGGTLSIMCTTGTIHYVDTNSNGMANFDCKQSGDGSGQVCPDGYEDNGTMCLKNVVSCGSGLALDEINDICYQSAICENGGVLDFQKDICVLDLATGYDNEKGSCIDEWNPKCEDGYILNNGVCEAEPICPNGAIFNSEKKQCEQVLSCPTDMVYDDVTGKCKKNVEVSDYFWLGRCQKDSSTATMVYTGHSEHEPPDGLNCDYYADVEPTSYDILLGNDFTPGSIKKCSNDTDAKCSWKPITTQRTGKTNRSFANKSPYPYGEHSYVVDYRINNTTEGALWGKEERDKQAHYGFKPFYRKYNTKIPMPYTTDTPTHGWTFVKTSPDVQIVEEDLLCPSGYLKQGLSCLISASCLDGGTFNQNNNMCEKEYQIDCPTGSTYNATLDVCIGSVDCGEGVLDKETQRCIIPNTINESTCPLGYSYSPYPISKCEAVPLCSIGTYIPQADSTPLPWNGQKIHTQWDKCYVDDNICPYGNEYSCNPVGAYDSVNYCSPWQCVSSGSGYTNEYGTAVGETDKPDDGVVDENGCNGNIYIFNGRDNRCGSWNLWEAAAGSSNCCNQDNVVFGLVSCSKKEVALAKQNEKKLCHYIGQYCSKEECYPVAGCNCTQKKKTYCCYNSLLGRIIQEQARANGQLDIPWGSAEDPNCRGLTPEEFEKIDFSQLDMSEYEASIAASMPPSNTAGSEFNNDRTSALSKTQEIKAYGNSQ